MKWFVLNVLIATDVVTNKLASRKLKIIIWFCPCLTRSNSPWFSTNLIRLVQQDENLYKMEYKKMSLTLLKLLQHLSIYYTITELQQKASCEEIKENPSAARQLSVSNKLIKRVIISCKLQSRYASFILINLIS